jgi:hypothetical protein
VSFNDPKHWPDRPSDLGDVFGTDRVIAEVRDVVRDADPRVGALGTATALWRTILIAVDFDEQAARELLLVTLNTAMEYEKSDRSERRRTGLPI